MPHLPNRDELEHSLRAMEQKQHNLRMHHRHLNHQLTALSSQRQALLQEAGSSESLRQLTEQEQKLLRSLEAVQDMQEQLKQEQATVEQLLAVWHKQARTADELTQPLGNS